MRTLNLNHVSALFLIAVLSQTPTARSDVRLAKVFSDHAVLQRDRPIAVWGWAAPGETVTIRLAGKSATVMADSDGKWRADLHAMPAGGPYKLTVSGKNNISVQDVLVGEVWLCVGQSNMQLMLKQTQFAGRDIPKAADPQYRLGNVQLTVACRPQADVNVSWTPSSPGAAAGFSAVAYYFGKELREKLRVPVAVLNASAGGIPIESWTPAVGCQMVPSQTKFVRMVDQVYGDYCKARQEGLNAWLPQARQAILDEKPLPPMTAVSDLMVQRGWMPLGLCNGSILPLAPYGIRGAIFYQGEANNGHGMEYYEKMRALVGGWRKAWGQGDFPFYYVQIAPWRGYPEGNIEGIWEAQLAALAIPNTGMAVITDLVPDLNNIHPPMKADIGRRLALWALAKTYGQGETVCSGPLFKSVVVEGKRVRVHFDYVGSGLTTRDGKAPNWFQVGTPDGFVDAEAKIDGDTVVVSSDKVPKPQYVRFGWKNVAQPNLVNKEGLPASPFRSDCGPVKFSTGSSFARHKRVEIFAEPMPGVTRYTLDGTTPNEQSPIYKAPVEITKITTVSGRFFAADGRTSVTAQATYRQVPPVAHEGKLLAPGVDYEFYIGRWIALPDFDKLHADRRGTLDGLLPITFPESFLAAHRFHGYLDIPVVGEWTFALKSQGGAQMFLDGKLIVDDNGYHGPIEKPGERIWQSAGKHAFVITYHEGNAPPSLVLLWKGPGIAMQPVPAAAYYREEQ